MKKTVISTALATVFGVATMSTQAATLNAGDILTINSGVYNTDAYGNPINVASGSWLAFDTNDDSKTQGGEQSPITGLNGITVGSTQGPNDIDAWTFLAPGTHFTTVAPTGSTAGLDMSGWFVHWYDSDINLGSGAWTPGNCDASWMGCESVTFAESTGFFSWSGVYDDAYTLWYSATVPEGDASGFGGVQYIVYYEGIVLAAASEIPVPAAVWLLGSGLLTLVGVARRRGYIRHAG